MAIGLALRAGGSRKCVVCDLARRDHPLPDLLRVRVGSQPGRLPCSLVSDRAGREEGSECRVRHDSIKPRCAGCAGTRRAQVVSRRSGAGHGDEEGGLVVAYRLRRIHPAKVVGISTLGGPNPVCDGRAGRGGGTTPEAFCIVRPRLRVRSEWGSVRSAARVTAPHAVVPSLRDARGSTGPTPSDRQLRRRWGPRTRWQPHVTRRQPSEGIGRSSCMHGVGRAVRGRCAFVPRVGK